MPTLDWIGKQAVVKHHKEVPYRLLEPVHELSCGDPASGNLIVQGDNLHALKALLPRYAGQVKCIYIDPPYNTGNEGWAYNDNVNSPEIRKWLGAVVGKEGETLDRHDRWLCMMHPRLTLLRQFLREDGAIFVSIDDNEVATLRLLMDEIFGTDNFAASFIWEKRTTRENRRVFSFSHDYVLCYARRLESFEKTRGELPLSQDVMDRHKNPDNDPRGAWQSVAITAQAGHGTAAQFYTIKTPGGRLIDPPPGNCWRFTQPRLTELIAENRIYFGANGNNVPRQKKFLSEVERGLTPHTLWSAQEVGTTDTATKSILEIMGKDATFETPKAVGLIQRILQIATDKDSLVLDSFAGSGTTGHAVLKQNAEDSGNRRFILVEMDENIARNVTTERVKRVAQGYANAKGQIVEGFGGDFQFCKLSAEPLFTAEGQIRSDVTFAQLAEFVWFAETGMGKVSPRETAAFDSPLLGVHEGRAIYLLYNGILKDKSAGGGNVLTGPVLESLPTFGGPKVIYAAACRLGTARLLRENITFKQTPYALEA
jgi:site-specific DNA-methyltransferase (adenine-specific)/adenine-specific DNA-methyltransferase